MTRSGKERKAFLLLSSPPPGSSHAAGFSFSVSQKKRAGYSYLSRWKLFLFLLKQRYDFSIKPQIITTIISTELTSFKHSVFSQISTSEGVLHALHYMQVQRSISLYFPFLIFRIIRNRTRPTSGRMRPAYTTRPEHPSRTRTPAARRRVFLAFGAQKSKPDARILAFYAQK